jgi:riboflavin kinase/FMN adenylyltransferase
VTFEPQPNEYFNSSAPPARLMTFREKWLRLSQQSVDYLFCIRFDQAFSQMSAQRFVEHLLVNNLNMQAIIVGDDFRFGAKREGDLRLLTALGEQFGFRVIQMPTLEFEKNRVSSSLIRKALQSGQLEFASKLLGRSYQILGKVVHGDKRGHALGFPTANIKAHRREVAVKGIFVVRVAGITDHFLPAVASFGTRPVFNGTHILLEVHLLDFSQNLYGKQITVEFLHKLRDEKNFAHIEDLITQMNQDVLDAREYFLQDKLSA